MFGALTSLGLTLEEDTLRNFPLIITEQAQTVDDVFFIEIEFLVSHCQLTLLYKKSELRGGYALFGGTGATACHLSGKYKSHSCVNSSINYYV